MADNSKIEWCNATWPIVTGCDYASPGCANCYAVRDARRLSGNPNAKVRQAYEGLVEWRGGKLRWTGVVRQLPARLDWPLHWRKPRKVFVCNESDLFHEDVPDTFLDQVFAVMALCPQHTFQVLTKRSARTREYFSRLGLRQELIGIEAERISGIDRYDVSGIGARWKLPMPHVHIGVSVENQAHLFRIDHLKDVPASVHFVSFEPLLEDLGAVILDGIEWGIIGLESGSNARPGNVKWVRSLVHEHKRQGVPVFVKQLGDFPVMDESVWREGGIRRLLNARHAHRHPPGTVPLLLYAKKGGNPDEWPEDLRVREFPEVRV